MKIIIKIITLFLLIISGFWAWITYAGPFDSEDEKKIEYCDWWECGLKEWVELAKTSVEWIVTEWAATDHIQKIITYLLSFITLIAVIYIIYAWFRIQTSSGDDEVIKTQKKTIWYVVVWIVVIWFAWTIANFAVGIGSWWQNITNNP